MIPLVEDAHDAEVHRGIARIVRITDVHEHVARVHVGVKEAVPEHLGEEYFDPPGGKLAHVHAGVLKRLDLPDRDPPHPLHHQDLAPAVVPIHGRHADDVRIRKAALQARSVGALAGQVHFKP